MNRNALTKTESIPKDPFGYIGFWQFLTFIMLLLLIWVSELQDIPALLFNTAPLEVNYFRACTLSAAVLITAVIAIGNTYLQQKRILTHLVSVCSNCHKVQISQNNWTRIEDYVSEHSPLTFTHGLCPECQARIMQTLENRASGKTDKSTPAPENSRY